MVVSWRSVEVRWGAKSILIWTEAHIVGWGVGAAVALPVDGCLTNVCQVVDESF